MRTKSTKNIDNHIYLALLLYHIVRTKTSHTYSVDYFVDTSVDKTAPYVNGISYTTDTQSCRMTSTTIIYYLKPSVHGVDIYHCAFFVCLIATLCKYTQDHPKRFLTAGDNLIGDVW